MEISEVDEDRIKESSRQNKSRNMRQEFKRVRSLLLGYPKVHIKVTGFLGDPIDTTNSQ